MSRTIDVRVTGKCSTRREVLRSLGAALAAVPLGHLVACSENAGAGAGGAGAGGTGGGAAATGGWAIGGTAAMTGDYADPFTAGLGSTCALTCAVSEGPCYAATLARKDISEGQDGLPLRVALLLVDESCAPIVGATVDVWHASPAGLYSGEDAAEQCTGGDAEAVAGRWFRGVQTTDERGRVDFDTCFPGWYTGRTIHIHVIIRIHDVHYVTTEFLFDDAVADEIVNTQPLYSDRGSRNANNTNDAVIAAAATEDFVFQTKQLPDGAMMAWKTLVLRTSTETALCEAPRPSR